MSIYQSETYLKDCKRVIDNFDYFKEFSNKSILVTGSTGLICSAVVDLLMMANEQYQYNIDVYAASRKQEETFKRFDRYVDNNNFHFIQYDATKEITFTEHFDYIIAGASNAYPAAISAYPIETMKDNITGIDNLLNYAHNCSSERVLYISSSEVYGKKETMEPFIENQYGFIDYLSPRSCYPIGKIAAETLCACYTQEKNVNVSIVRPGHIYGPTASRKDNRVSSVFAYDAADKKDLVMKSAGAQIRSYCYVMDCASAMLCVLLKGENNTAYNISNKNSIMSIKAISERYAKYGNVTLTYAEASKEELKTFNPMMNSSLDSTRLESLGWEGLFDKEEGPAHTIQIIQEAKL